jgi:hypothetical protein
VGNSVEDSLNIKGIFELHLTFVHQPRAQGTSLAGEDPRLTAGLFLSIITASRCFLKLRQSGLHPPNPSPAALFTILDNLHSCLIPVAAASPSAGNENRENRT